MVPILGVPNNGAGMVPKFHIITRHIFDGRQKPP